MLVHSAASAVLLAEEWLTGANELAKNGAFALYAVAATIALRVLWKALEKKNKENAELQKALNAKIEEVQQARLDAVEEVQGARVQDVKDTFRQMLDNNDAVVTALQGAYEAIQGQSRPAEMIRDALKQLGQEQRTLASELAKRGIGR